MEWESIQWHLAGVPSEGSKGAVTRGSARTGALALAASIATTRLIRAALLAATLFGGLGGCGPGYSPGAYADSVARQASTVDTGVLIGVRKVGFSAAAGGISGSPAGVGPGFGLAGLGSSKEGGAAAGASAYEYIVRKPNGALVSVTQTDAVPLPLGAAVRVTGNTQARVVLDPTAPLGLSGRADRMDMPEAPADAASSVDPRSAGAVEEQPAANDPGGAATDGNKPAGAGPDR